ncbi:cob(I)yrinic acid a,c-diamide adenosyltransferase [Deinococcus lacus]|uniref:Corrinoid adenosyltransferase n=1 Tax=Deinococcus lacus TaxID=392561 RepID=A0ABW1YA39_9DEIO
MKLYTRTGDAGETGLYGPQRVPKSSLRVEAYGTVDELSSLLGVARAHLAADPADLGRLGSDLAGLQNALFDLGADLATLPGSPTEAHLSRLSAADTAVLEQLTDLYQAQAPAFTGFVHPGGTLTAATLQLARAVARRAERAGWRLAEAGEGVNVEALVYLNRLSDLLFIMGRWANARAGVSEAAWAVGARLESGRAGPAE